MGLDFLVQKIIPGVAWDLFRCSTRKGFFKFWLAKIRLKKVGNLWTVEQRAVEGRCRACELILRDRGKLTRWGAARSIK